MPNQALADAVDAITGFLVSDAPLGGTLDRICGLVLTAILRADGAGITMWDSAGNPRTAVYRGELTPVVDRAQYTDDAGPCLEACNVGEVVRVDDTAAVAERWPTFSRVAQEAGVRSTLAIPMEAAACPSPR